MITAVAAAAAARPRAVQACAAMLPLPLSPPPLNAIMTTMHSDQEL